jgi:UDP-N-acetylglucosamine--N-acetylmuramyl-(pentapeptide) pyrophosphoryl-undecaprenol N-acetylglucosamine transferase
MNKKEKIILSGGATGGSVIPLLQIYQDLNNEFDFLFVGTYKGLEKKMVEKVNLRYRAILSGKWRRYFSLKNFLDIFFIFLSFWQCLFLLLQEKPKMIISAGGFVAVPLSWAAGIMRIPVIIHQQDVVPGLANKLMAKLATAITVTFEQSKKVYGAKALYIGNIGPSLENLEFNKEEIINKYKLKNSALPLIIIIGGGTGSLFLNKLVNESLHELLSIAKIIHISGSLDRDVNFSNYENNENYLKLEFIDHQDLLALFSLADIIISRCGLATLTELSFLKKVAILIPMPDSHQEFNALEFKKREAAIVLDQKNLTADNFIKEIKEILNNEDLRKKLTNNISLVIKNGNQAMIDLIKKII